MTQNFAEPAGVVVQRGDKNRCILGDDSSRRLWTSPATGEETYGGSSNY